MDLSKSVVREVLEKGEPVLLYEALKDDRYGDTESIVLQQIQSIACMPISLKKKRIGALYLDSVNKRGRFTKSYLPFLEAFTNQAAIATGTGPVKPNAQRGEPIAEERNSAHSWL